MPVRYKDLRLDCGYKIDIVADERVILERKCADRIAPPVLRQGLKRLVL